jgi:hypothetical protein
MNSESTPLGAVQYHTYAACVVCVCRRGARMYMGKFNVVFYVAQYVFSSTETKWPKDILKIHRKSYLFYWVHQEKIFWHVDKITSHHLRYPI